MFLNFPQTADCPGSRPVPPISVMFQALDARNAIFMVCICYTYGYNYARRTFIHFCKTNHLFPNAKLFIVTFF